MERGNEQAKKTAKDEVPGDRIKDAPALARELRWRVRLVNGYTSDGDVRSRRKLQPNGVSNGSSSGSATKKRKRSEEEADVEEASQMFLHFKPRRWDGVVTYPAEKEVRTIKSKEPAGDETEWTESWTVATDIDMREDGEDAMVERRREVVVKVRRTAKGLERQRIERTLEEWTWDHKAADLLAPASASSETNSPTLAATNGGSDSATVANSAGDAKDVKMETNGAGD